ncbi:hypothetical protein BGP_6312 [Beggiatoa sp. PS]|nr:hypothetical protein BGP_6312 [Beggiatoa sp. PS]
MDSKIYLSLDSKILGTNLTSLIEIGDKKKTLPTLYKSLNCAMCANISISKNFYLIEQKLVTPFWTTLLLNGKKFFILNNIFTRCSTF